MVDIFSAKLYNKIMKNKNITKDIVYIAIFVALMTVFTLFVSIPFYPVPLTFQTVICVLSGLLLGAKRGTAAMLIYVFAGLVLAMPIFSGGRGGFTAVLSPTFGYILGFPAAALTAGLIRGKKENAGIKRYFIAALCAFAVCYAIGIPYFLLIWKYYLGNSDILHAAVSFNIIYMPKDLILCMLAAPAAKKIATILFLKKDNGENISK